METLRKKIGQLFQLGLNGTSLTPQQKTLFKTYPPGALRITPFITKFIPQKEGEPAPAIPNAELAKTYESVSRLVFDACGSPPIIRDGMEGGDWNCLIQDRYPVGPMFLGYANHNDPGLTARAIEQVAQSERAMGLRCSDVLLDFNFDRRNAAMNLRTLGAHMPTLISQAKTMVKTLQDNGIIPVIKHFPCQSYGAADTHFEEMVVPLTPQDMEKTVFPPYRELLDETVCVMLSHTKFPAIDKNLPTTLSRKIVTGLLRKTFGFNGVIMTDSITMASILDRHPIPEACVAALAAGVDQILLKAEDFFGPAVLAVEKAVQSGRLPESQVDVSCERILALKKNYGLTHPFRSSADAIEKTLHSDKTQTIWTTVGQAVTRALRTGDHEIPLNPKPGEKWLVLENNEGILDTHCNDDWHHASILGKALEKRFPKIEVVKRFVPYCETPEEGKMHIFEAEQFDRVIVGAFGTRTRPNPLGISLALANNKIGHIAVVNNPFDADKARLPAEAHTVICPFGFFRFSILGSVSMLAGDIPINPEMGQSLAQNSAEAWVAA